ncbi:hypothetical protein M431DRAFT_491802 [Trichoderma harzianum CBS 226.95]|uniref:Uncharacterized protein n=1 Tax=Trichoderma harzianum CBS 226.95 TaxID=983964 RepID=A0A2T4AKJ4_TRIHA|nr:hypothetical protein M431DRAFT_491802 [Trichoderma harzianum CBS 226.95]PTB57567.1 hypothetical protein M431DRAFT_491802 [Trichoderma harzianum CBS 226.95]
MYKRVMLARILVLPARDAHVVHWAVVACKSSIFLGHFRCLVVPRARKKPRAEGISSAEAKPVPGP